MADIETSVAITAQTGDLQSGMAAAADSVEAATAAMQTQLAGLGAAAQQAQSQIGAAAAQIGSTIGALHAKAASLAASVGTTAIPGAAAANGRGQVPGISVTQSGGSDQRGGDDRVQVWRAELRSQLSDERAFFNDSKSEELSFWQGKVALTEAGSRSRLAVENNIYQLEKQLAIQSERDALAALAADEKSTDAAYARKKAAITADAALGKISANEEIAQQQGLLEAKWALDQGYFDKKLAAAENDSRTRQKLVDEEDLAYQKFLTDKQKLDIQAVQNSAKAWQGLLQPVERAVDTSVAGIIMGTTTVQKALANLAQSIIAEFVNSAVKSVFGQLGKLLGAGLVGANGAGGDSGNQDFSGGVNGFGESVVESAGSSALFGSGGLLGALGLGSLFGGGGIIGSLFKGIGSLFAFERGGIVPSAAGGWMVPSASLAMLHTNEMVLPADISQGLQGMIAGGGGSPSGGGAAVMFNVSAIDSQSVAKFFHANGSTLVAAINRAMRNGATLRSA